MKKILVVGAKGQLGNEFQVLAKDYPSFQFSFYDIEEMDITNTEAVEKEIRDLQPDYLINCAAYTAVDKAETDVQLAHSINANAVKNLAVACSKNNVRFVHISTDYVFEGNGTSPYKEDDSLNPLSVYGKTKLEGEQEALKYNKDVIIIRTAWVYSIYGNNFVKTMLRLMKAKPEINVVADQYGSPTYAYDLADAIMRIISSQNWISGVYHFTNNGIITWFDFACEIKNLSHTSCLVHPITTEQYPTAAKRPKYSVLDKTKIQQTFGIKLKDWKQSLEQCLKKTPSE